MIYDLSLHTVGIIAGVFLVLMGLLGLIKPSFARVVQRLPRSRTTGVILLTVCLVWTFWLLYTIQMCELSGFSRQLLISLLIGFVIVLSFVDDYFAVFALNCL